MNTSGKITNTMELEPCYGRDYKNAAEVKAAFLAGKDFGGDYSIGFKPCGVQDFASGTRVLLRYKRNTMVAVVKVP